MPGCSPARRTGRTAQGPDAIDSLAHQRLADRRHSQNPALACAAPPSGSRGGRTPAGAIRSPGHVDRRASRARLTPHSGSASTWPYVAGAGRREAGCRVVYASRDGSRSAPPSPVHRGQRHRCSELGASAAGMATCFARKAFGRVAGSRPRPPYRRACALARSGRPLARRSWIGPVWTNLRAPGA